MDDRGHYFSFTKADSSNYRNNEVEEKKVFKFGDSAANCAVLYVNYKTLTLCLFGLIINHCLTPLNAVAEFNYLYFGGRLGLNAGGTKKCWSA